MKRVYDNGIYRPATPEEQAEYERMLAEAAQVQALPSPEERLAALEASLAERDLIIAELMTTIN